MTRYGSRAPEIIAMRFITDAVASAHKAASRKDAFLRCCNSLARSREPLACLRPRAFALPITSMAKYLSSIRLASVLLASTPSSGGRSSGSNTVWASEISASRHKRPTAWNCSSVVAVCNLERISPSCRSTNGQPVGSGKTPESAGSKPSRTRSSIGSKRPLIYSRRDLYVGRSPLLHFPYQSHKSEYGTGFRSPFAVNRAVN